MTDLIDADQTGREAPHSAPPGPARCSLRARLRPESAVNVVVLTITLLLVVPPIFMLIFSSFKKSGTLLPFEVPGFSLGNYVDSLFQAQTVQLLLRTVLYSVLSVGISLIISLALAVLLERSNMPGRRLLSTLVLSPMAIPGVVLAIAWTFLANPNNGIVSGWIETLTGAKFSIYSLAGMVIVTAMLTVPSMYMMIVPALANIDTSLEDAARMSGASAWVRVRRVTLALLRPSVLSAGIFFLIATAGAFEIPVLLGVPNHEFLFSSLIYDAVVPASGLPDYGRASTYGVVLFVIALLLVMTYRQALKGAGRFEVIRGKRYGQVGFNLGAWRWPAAALVGLYTIIVTVFPLAIIVWSSLLRSYSVPSWNALKRLTLDNYVRVFQMPEFGESLVNTVVVGLVAATATMVIATWICWLRVSRKSWMGTAGVELSFLVLGVPGVVLGTSMGFLYLFLDLHVYGTVWIIIIAFVTIYLSYATRLMDTAFRQIEASLEEAARVLGASTLSTLRLILLPLLRPAFIRGWLWVLVQSSREVALAVILYVAGNQTISVLLWNTWVSAADFSLASALAVIITLISVTLTSVLSIYSGRSGLAVQVASSSNGGRSEIGTTSTKTTT